MHFSRARRFASSRTQNDAKVAITLHVYYVIGGHSAILGIGLA